jgi:hypothetical protein
LEAPFAGPAARVAIMSRLEGVGCADLCKRASSGAFGRAGFSHRRAHLCRATALQPAPSRPPAPTHAHALNTPQAHIAVHPVSAVLPAPAHASPMQPPVFERERKPASVRRACVLNRGDAATRVRASQRLCKHHHRQRQRLVGLARVLAAGLRERWLAAAAAPADLGDGAHKLARLRSGLDGCRTKRRNEVHLASRTININQKWFSVARVKLPATGTLARTLSRRTPATPCHRPVTPAPQPTGPLESPAASQPPPVERHTIDAQDVGTEARPHAWASAPFPCPSRHGYRNAPRPRVGQQAPFPALACSALASTPPGSSATSSLAPLALLSAWLTSACSGRAREP